MSHQAIPVIALSDGEWYKMTARVSLENFLDPIPRCTMPNQPKRPWRKDSTPTGRSGDAAKPWREDKAIASGKSTSRKLSKKTKFFLALPLFLAMVALLLWVATLLNPPSQAYLILVGADGAENLGVPHNLYGWKGLQDLHAFAQGQWQFLWNDKQLFHVSDLKSLTHNPKVDWAEDLKKQPKEKTVIVYLALHGGADAKGPYLIPSDYKVYPGPEDKQGSGALLRVSEVLERLAELPAGKNKVLILDATQITAHWPLGLLHNDFARQLKETLKEKIDQIPNLVVLSASAPGQRSWVSEEWGQTVFGHYVVEGLKGDADKNGDYRVTALELAEYVEENVRNWVRANRDEEQTPERLVSKDTQPEHIPLVMVEKSNQEVEAKKALPTQSKGNDELKAAWQKCQELREQFPAAYSPHLWRRYLDTLLRYEQVLRAGDPTDKALRLLGNLGTLEKEIKDSRRPFSLQKLVPAALPMHVALGQLPRWREQELKSGLHALQTTNKEKWSAVLQGLREQLEKTPDGEASGLEAASETLLRLRLVSVLLKEAAGENRLTEEERTKLRELSDFLLPRGGLRPAEVHFLLMLRDLNKPEPEPALLGQALQVRLLAEEVVLAAKDPPSAIPGAYPYSERVYPWIKAQVEATDSERRRGEELLFGADKADWEKARQHLQKAAAAYEKAHQEALVVRQALNIRDEVLAALPYYSQWLARRRLTPDPRARPEKEKEIEQRLNDVESLWTNTHLLAYRLKIPDPNGINQAPGADKLYDPDPKSLKERTELVKTAFREIAAAFEAQSATINVTLVHQQNWHEIDDAMTVPLIEPSRRIELLRGIRVISEKLSASNTPMPPHKEHAQENVRWQGRMALAVLGRPWIDRHVAQKDTATFADLHRQVTQVGRTDWWTGLNDAGQQLGILWSRLPGEVQQFSQKSSTTEALKDRDPKDYMQERAQGLADTEELCRQLDGAAAATLTFNPVQEDRRLHLHNLLLGQAERTRLDHWWFAQEDASAGVPPYYLTVAKAYLGAAEELIGLDVEDPDLKKLRQASASKSLKALAVSELDAKPTVPSTLELTTDRDFKVAWKISTKNLPPQGIAMVRLKTEGSLEPADKEARYDVRKPLIDWSPDAMAYKLISPELNEAEKRPPLVPKKKEGAQATLELLYRGRWIKPHVNINLHLGADTIVNQHPRPEGAGIAIRAEENIPRGAVAIVLDYSGSMGNLLKSGPRTSKIDLARNALRQVLTKLGDGTILSVWVFGHQISESNTEESAASTKVKNIRPAGPWRREQLPELMGQVTQLKPMNWTNLVESILSAKEELLESPQCRGLFKTIVVLTDGNDTMFENRLPEAQRQKAIQNKIREEFNPEKLGKEKITINMVLFGDNKIEQDLARNQFKDVIEQLRERGTWDEAQDGNKLAIALREALRPRLYLLQDGNPMEGMPLEGYKVSFPGENWSWSKEFKPRKGQVYQAQVQNTYQRVGFDPGDYLLVNLKRDPGAGITFERRLSVEEFATRSSMQGKPSRNGKEGSWLLAVHQNQHEQSTLTGNSLNLLLTLENYKSVLPLNGLLEQLEPGFKWFELKAGGEPPAGLRWSNVSSYPAPAWNLRVAKWPIRGEYLAPPEMDAWLIDDPSPRVHHLTLQHDPTKDLEEEFKQPVHVRGGEVAIESVRQEDREVTVTPGDRKLRPCLVVRLRHEPGKPIWVQLRGPGSLEGEEHHFYRAAGKVTAIFWPVRRVAEEEFTLHLISLEAFKQDAFHVRLLLPTPTPGDRGPLRVTLEKP
jgi:hypothetical protein